MITTKIRYSLFLFFSQFVVCVVGGILCGIYLVFFSLRAGTGACVGRLRAGGASGFIECIYFIHKYLLGNYQANCSYRYRFER